MPAAERPLVRAVVVSRAPASRPSTTTHSASRTTAITAKAALSAAQAQVNGLRRFLLSQSTRPPEASRTIVTPRPAPTKGRNSPANTPMPTHTSSTRDRAGTPASGHTEPNAESTREALPTLVGRVTGWPGKVAGGAGGVIGWFLSGVARVSGLLVICGACRGSSTRKRAPDSPATGSIRPIRPPCRSVTHRAIARPSPVPPPAGSCRVPNRSKTRSRCSGSIPEPSSETSRRKLSATSPAHTRTTPPVGLCRTALSRRLASSWCSRERSACTERSAGSMRTSNRTWRISAPASATASSTSVATGTSVRSSATTPASTRERSSRSPTRVLSRSACPSATRMVAGSGSVTPSSRFSSTATSAVNGVRSSCETLATRSRRWRSTVARSAAIRLNA